HIVWEERFRRVAQPARFSLIGALRLELLLTAPSFRSLQLRLQEQSRTPQCSAVAKYSSEYILRSNRELQSIRCCPKQRPAFECWPQGTTDRIRYLVQVSLTIFRSVTRRSPYSSLPAAFSTWPSFFSSAFSCALDSRRAEPVSVT